MNPYANWELEQRSAYLYRVCADAEIDDRHAALFARLAGEALAQAAIWRAQLTSRGHAAPSPYSPDVRTRVVAALVRRLGPQRARGVLAAMKVRVTSIEDAPPPRAFGQAAPLPMPAGARRHGGRGGGSNLHAAVVGINDGIVSNASLMLGMAGANPNAHVVLLTGVAGMCAGALAVAAGEYVSVRSQREMVRRVGPEHGARPRTSEAKTRELELLSGSKGAPAAGAQRPARRSAGDADAPPAAVAQAEPQEAAQPPLAPWRAASAAFLSFAAGALVPLAPFLLLPEAAAWPAAATATALALFAVGAALSLLTGRSALIAGARTLALGSLAGAITFAVGWLAGVGLG